MLGTEYTAVYFQIFGAGSRVAVTPTCFGNCLAFLREYVPHQGDMYFLKMAITDGRNM
jgi:hypothetical protein